MDEVMRILERLMSIPSVSSDAAACSRIVDEVRSLLPATSALTVHEVERDGTRSLVACTRPGRHARLVLNAHLDVVPARADQFRLAVEGTVARGRGVYDMKGAAAVFLQLVGEVAVAADPPDVQLQIVTDEEIGGHRGAAVLLEDGFTGDFFIAGEPTDMRLCNRAKGVLWLTVRVPGAPGHAAMPWLSRNPLAFLHHGLARVLERFPVPQSEVWATTATPTAIQAGDAHNRVPGEAVLKLDIRRVPEDDADEITSFVRRCFPGATVEETQRAPGMDTPSSDAHVRELMEAQAAETGRPVELLDVHYGSDARYWAAVGVPAVCWGPTGGGMHADDEWLDLDSLRVYRAILRRLVGLP